ncbi:MAG TPA: thioredoxin-like domain-containing protein [Candidatus Methylacidiphilales bacterium]|jgi:nucleoredoxin|nr:thioredoxin-like domain-containing protein [Candidatus Methylacidiphilales bacterium]
MHSISRKTFCAALLLLVSSFCASEAQNAAPASADPTGLGAKFSYHLVKLDGGVLKPFDTASLNNVKYFAFYYSASWCPPCRVFTPKLVDFYNSFKPQHPDFEVIFVNHDNSADDMLAYMKADGMTWPAARFEDIDGSNANQYCGDGIPDLVLVDSSGKVLSNSFIGSNYVGPGKVLDDIKRMVH